MLYFFKKNRKKILQFFRVALLSGLAFLLLLMITVSVVLWVYQDRIKSLFISQINQGLTTEVLIENIHVGFLRSFPYASIRLTDVQILEATQKEDKDILLNASSISFRFSIFDLLSGNYSISSAYVSSGFLTMKVFSDGENNYTFWRPVETDNQKSSALEFGIKRLVFSDFRYRYIDDGNGHNFDFLIGRTTITGFFSAQNYLMQLNGNMQIADLIINNGSFINELAFNFDFELEVDNNTVFSFRKGLFQLGAHKFTASGNLDLQEELPYADIEISASHLKLENVITDLPVQYARYFDGYRSRGDFYFDAHIVGSVSNLVKPFISAGFGITNGDLHHRKANLHFQDITFSASFDNGRQRNLTTSTLTVDSFRAYLNQKSLKGNLQLHNFNEPGISARIFSDIKADDWYRFLKPKEVRYASGDLFIDLEFQGRLDENKKFTSYHFMASQVKGEVRTRNLEFGLENDDLDYNSFQSELFFNNNDVVIHNFSGKASSSDFDLKGYFRNVIPWLFLPGERLFVDASLVSDNLNFNELLQHSVSESDTTYRLRLSENIDFKLEAQVGQLAFRKFEAQNITGSLSMRQQGFHADNIALQAMQGYIKASGYINGRNPDYLIMGCDALITNVDVNDLFYQLGNFGQQSIVHENLRGRLTADASFISRWSPNLEINWEALETTANIKVENGELINYKPMLALSRFIRVGDLNEVKFSTLENQIKIKNQKIFIPDMEINSSAINIRLSGEHSFQNEINYRLQVLLSDLLARRNRENRNPQEQYGDIIDDGLGRTTLFLLVTGTTDDPVFRYDRQGVRDKLREDFRQERQNLRNILRNEFGTQQPDTLPDGSLADPTERQKEQKEIKEGEKGRFIIEWDED